MNFSEKCEQNDTSLRYTRGIIPKRVTSGGVYLRSLAPGPHSSEETSQRWRAFFDSGSDWTDPRIQPQTSRTVSNNVMFFQTDLEIQRERVELLLQQQGQNERELASTSQVHSDRLQQMKEQFARERSAMKKQLQVQISEVACVKTCI